MRVRKQLVSGASAVSPGTNGRQYITVHQTGNTSAGANAAAHANLQSGGNSRSASWHYTVDDKEAVQSFPHKTRCWHAGDGAGLGNYSSIAVEHCVNSDGNYLQTLRNGAALVARIAEEEGIPTSRIVQHSKWSGKDCPTQLRAGKGGVSWAEYLAMVDAARTPETKDWFDMATESQLEDALRKVLREDYLKDVAKHNPRVQDGENDVAHYVALNRLLILARRNEAHNEALLAAVDALAKSSGLSPTEIKATVSAAVNKALAGLSITLTTEES